MKNLVSILFIIFISLNSISQTHKGCDISKLKTTSFDTTKTLMYVLVIRYEGEVVSVKQLGERGSYIGEIEINSNKLTQSHIIELVSKYSATLKDDIIKLKHFYVYKDGFRLNDNLDLEEINGYYIEDIEGKESDNPLKRKINEEMSIPTYLTATLEVITFE